MILVWYNLKSVIARRGTAIATMLAVALVTLVLSASLMLSSGLEETLVRGARGEVAVVVRRGADSEPVSVLDEASLAVVKSVSELRGAVVAETVVLAALPRVGGEGSSNLAIRGVDAESYALRSELKIVEGRAPKPGTDEAIAGARIRGRLEGVELGSSFLLSANRPLTIVGVFTAGGSAAESEVWADRAVVAAAFGRAGTISSVRVPVASAEVVGALRAELEADKRLGVSVWSEKEFQEKQSENLALFIRTMGILIAVLFSVGAALGAAITMHGAVAGRQAEIGTLRALGFSAGRVLFGFLLEALALTAAGGLLGAAASLALGGLEIAMVNQTTWSQLVFAFVPTTSIIGGALIVAGVIGLCAGLFPAIRAARLSPLQAIARC